MYTNTVRSTSCGTTADPIAPCPPMEVTLKEMRKLFCQIRTRVVFIRDKATEARNEWITDMYGEVPQYRYFENSTAAFSAVRNDYQVFLAHGEDSRRLSKILRTNRAILGSKIKIALMGQSLPQDRAQLLNAGYDLAVDTRMAKEEFVARVTTIFNRHYRHAPRIIGPLDDLRIVLRRFVKPSVPAESLNNRELLLLARLAARKGMSVHVSELQRSANGHNYELTAKSLCVAISRLRSKLAPQFCIVSDYMNGYVFKECEAG